jgi:Flp pilus assembly protein TadD
MASDHGVEQAAMLLGSIEQSSGNCAKAAEFYSKAVQVNSRNWISLNNLAACLVAIRKHDEALKYAQQAKELSPNNPSVTDTLGWTLYNKGLFSSAAKELETLKASKNPVHQYHLAMAYIKSGQLAKGRTILENARTLDRNMAEAKIAMDLYREASQQAQQQ